MSEKQKQRPLEQFDDALGQLCYRFTLNGPPRTKKNHGSVVMRGRRKVHVPSQAWTEWMHACRGYTLQNKEMRLELVRPVNCAAVFYRDRLNGDAVGYYQGLADVLEAMGIVVNDKHITQWDGSRLSKDADNPRTVVTLTVLKAEAR